MKKITTLLMLMSIVLAYGQRIDIKGKINDKKGQAIENANIIIIETNKGTTTTLDGEYKLKDIKVKNITIKVSLVGYASITKKTTLKNGINTINFTLNSKTEQLDEVVVTDYLSSSNKVIATANRLGVKPIDMPNSSGIISADLIKEQQALTLGEAIANVSGVFQFNKGYGGTSETFGARGVSLRYLGFMFRDGLRFGANQSLATPELQAFEKVEVLKGGAAINFGYVSPGATINYVTKKPFYNTKGVVSLRYGSYDYIKPTLDFNAKLSSKLAFRLVSTADLANSFRETVKSKRYYNYGAFRYIASQNTTIDLNIDYLADKRPADFGLPIFDDRIVIGEKDDTSKDGKSIKKPVYMNETKVQKLYYKVTKDVRSRFLGSSFNNRNSNQLNSNLKLDTKLKDNWNLIVATAVSISRFNYLRTGSGFSNQYFLEGNDIKIKRSLEKQEWEENSYGAQANLYGKFDFLGMKNKTSFSIDYDNRTQNTTNYNSIKGFDETYLFKRVPEKSLVIQDKTYLGKSKFQGFGLSLQNLLRINKHLNLLASVRLDKVNGGTKNKYLTDGKDNKKGDITDKKFDDVAFTPNVGVTYKFTESNSLFASYTNTFVPNNRFKLGEDDQVLPSYYTAQFEIGTKNSFLDNKIHTNITYYIMDANNYVTSPDIPERYVIGPGTKYRGIELDFSTQPIKGLTINTNYSYIDAEYNKGGRFKEGTRPQQTPKHQIGFWSRYRFNKEILHNFSINLGGQYTSERLGNDFYRGITPYIQEAYTMLNAGVGYKKGNFDLALKVTNLLDEFVFFSYRYGSVNPIDIRQFSLTTIYTF